jgi:hypothetical protein
MSEPNNKQCAACKREIARNEVRIRMPHRGQSVTVCSNECRRKLAKPTRR